MLTTKADIRIMIHFLSNISQRVQKRPQHSELCKLKSSL